MGKQIGNALVGREARILKPVWLFENPIRLLGGECESGAKKNAESGFSHREDIGSTLTRARWTCIAQNFL
jgi:hypothetical protein